MCAPSIIPPYWHQVFPDHTERSVPADTVLLITQNEHDAVHFVVEGGFAEVKADLHGNTHIVGISGSGTVLGARSTRNNGEIQKTHGIALVDSTVRSIQSTQFLSALVGNKQCMADYMQQLAIRLELAHSLSEYCAAATTAEHLLGVIRTIEACLAGSAASATTNHIRGSILERITGTPSRIVDSTIRELSKNGLINYQGNRIQWIPT